MVTLGFFDEAAGVGSRILNALAGAEGKPQVREYLGHLRRIYEILALIHDRIVQATVDLTQAKDMDEARGIIATVSRGSLKAALKARNLCDELEDLGHQLQPLVQESGQLTRREKEIWNTLCHELQGREEEVAGLYDESLYDLDVLPHRQKTIEALREEVETIANTLVHQKAKFDLLAKKADATLKRLN